MLTNTLGYPRIGSCKKWLLCPIIGFMLQSVSYCQTITTVAGNGTYGYTGDGGQATAATLKNAEIVALDAVGNIYISGDGSHAVRKVTVSTGIITTIAGNGTAGNTGDGGLATAAQLDFPMGLAFDAAGNLFIADFYNANIRRVDASTGIITTVAGNGTSGFSGDSGLAIAAELYYPFGVAVNDSGSLYISDLKNSRIRKVAAATGIITTIAGNGTAGFSGDGGLATAAELNYPQIIIFDASNNLYIADQENNRVRKIDASTGVITTIVGNGTGGFTGDGGQATAAEIDYPVGLAFDGAGNLYIGDQNNKRVRKVTAATGVITTIAGTGTSGYSGDGGSATSAKLSYLDGVAVDAQGDVYIADTGNNRIRKVTGNTAVLPVELVSFAAACNNENVLLTWSTASEHNNHYFTIQKSIDSINWEALGTIGGAGNSAVVHNYSFTTQKPENHVSYYRLEQTDFDGQITYSEIISANNCSENAIASTIYPNPTQNDLTILFNKEESNTIVLSDCMGKVLYKTTTNATTIRIPMTIYPAGIYTLSIISSNDRISETKKVVKIAGN